ncbi:hypothetical protein ACFX2J_022740 [Malus domestica]
MGASNRCNPKPSNNPSLRQPTTFKSDLTSPSATNACLSSSLLRDSDCELISISSCFSVSSSSFSHEHEELSWLSLNLEKLNSVTSIRLKHIGMEIQLGQLRLFVVFRLDGSGSKWFYVSGLTKVFGLNSDAADPTTASIFRIL